ncbi:hypothetical protein BH10PSE7_BH10PSE7_17620 [soil metagenome]
MRLSRRSLLLGAGALAFAPRTAFALAIPPRPGSAPRPSDVCFSSRWARTNAAEAARAFGATRLDWCYGTDKAFFDAMRAVGIRTIGGALNAELPDAGSDNQYTLGRVLDRQGKRVTAPFMKSWGVFNGCVNSPEYRATYLGRAKQALVAGADWFVTDDPGMNYTAIAWGGCYCRYCRKQAAAEGLDLDTQMRPFQLRSVKRFYADMRVAINRAAGREITLAGTSVVDTKYRWMAWPQTDFPFSCCELGEKGLNSQDLAAKLTGSELAGRPTVITLRSQSIALNRRVLAWCYAHGGNMIAPWDVFLGEPLSSTERFFGNPADYAPLYQFARSLGSLLDEAVPGNELPSGSWSASRPGLGTSLRVNPGGRFAVLHLVSWENDGPFSLTFDAARLVAGHRVNAARLLGPGGIAVALDHSVDGNFTCNVPGLTWAAVEMRLTA